MEYLRQLVERQKRELSLLYTKVRELEGRIRNLEEEVRGLNEAAGVYEDLGLQSLERGEEIRAGLRMGPEAFSRESGDQAGPSTRSRWGRL